jgi:hypothetical protein
VRRRFVDELGDQLQSIGIRGRLRHRIVVEFEDHLTCDPAAQLGSPAELANQFADEIGTSRVRRGTVAVFGALALAGTLFGIAMLAFGYRALREAQAQSRPLAMIGAVVMVVASQFAFATGMLAALRLLWRRRERVLSRSEATVLVRRVGIALVSGIGAMAGLALLALGIHDHDAATWRTFSLIAASIGGAALLAAAPSAIAAARLRPTASGETGDVFDDLGPLNQLAPAWLRGRPWRFALLVAATIGIAVALQGVAVSDPYDGIFRGLAESLACLTGFTVLGRYIGLRSAPA